LLVRFGALETKLSRDLERLDPADPRVRQKVFGSKASALRSSRLVYSFSSRTGQAAGDKPTRCGLAGRRLGFTLGGEAELTQHPHVVGK